MDSKKPSDFLNYCGNDITKLHQETEPGKKAHLMRRINMQMYAEACKQNYDNHTICKILSDDLEEYIQFAAPVQEKKFEDMMKTLNIDVKPGTTRSTINADNILKSMKSKKCEGVCKNDKLLDDLDTFFNSMKKKPVLLPSSSKATVTNPNQTNKFNSNTTTTNTRFTVDESNGDLVFDTNFKRIGQNVQQPFQPLRDNQSTSQDYRLPDNNQPMFSDHQSSSYRPAETSTTSNSFNPYGGGGLKRKQLEPANDFFKRSTNPMNREPEKSEPNSFIPKNDFKSASEELVIQYNKKHGGGNQKEMAYNTNPNGGLRRSLGGRRTVTNKFVPPFANQENNANHSNQTEEVSLSINGIDMSHPRLKNVDPKMAETISNEIMDQCDRVEWDSIAGLEYAKKTLREAVVLPILRPDIFTGLRQPPRGVLLFGPPGTGKTLIGKCIASQSESTFFSISASSLTSKWIGEGEKMVRALFAVAAAVQPSVVFIDEVDSLLCQRSESEHESSRRLKTEFLVQLDGTSTTERDKILIVGATNRPQELDEAARRRFVKRLYIPLPEFAARKELLFSLISTENHVMTESHLEEVARRTQGFSGADMKVLCQEAVMGPVRSISFTDMKSVSAENVRPVTFTDFLDAMKCVRASVSQDDLQQYVDWNNKYGSGSGV